MRISSPLFNMHADGGGGWPDEPEKRPVMIAASLTGAVFDREGAIRQPLFTFFKDVITSGAEVTILVPDGSDNARMERFLERFKKKIEDSKITNMPAGSENPLQGYTFAARDELVESGQCFDFVIDDDYTPYSGIEYLCAAEPDCAHFNEMIADYHSNPNQDLFLLITNYFDHRDQRFEQEYDA